MAEVPNDVPEWAIEKAVSLANKAYGCSFWSKRDIPCNIALTAFARYIAENEEAPVDPIMKEAQALYDFWLTDQESGSETVDVIFVALKRGIELAKSGATT